MLVGTYSAQYSTSIKTLQWAWSAVVQLEYDDDKHLLMAYCGMAKQYIVAIPDASECIPQPMKSITDV